jgi:hypothetical protein
MTNEIVFQFRVSYRNRTLNVLLSFKTLFIKVGMCKYLSFFQNRMCVFIFHFNVLASSSCKAKPFRATSTVSQLYATYTVYDILKVTGTK